MSTYTIHDLTERQLALDPTKSFIVQAPAGSGKTSLLVERYLTLLTYVKNPEEITAITFTRKAAHEMRNRIIKKLDQTTHRHIIQNPKRLRIQTIDAFCHYLIGQAPIFTKINTNFPIVQNQEAEIYYSKAAKAILENLSDPPYAKHLERLLLHLANDLERVENLFITMLKSREQWLPHIVGLKNAMALRQKMELALAEVSQENLERAIALFPKELHQELADLLKTAQKHHDEPPPTLQNITYEGALFQSNLITWQGVAEILLTKQFSWRKKITKEHGFPAPNPKDPKTKQELLKKIKADMASLLERLNQHEILRESLENLLLAPPQNYSDQEWQIIESLLELLPLLAAHLKVIFNENMVTDHTEISMAALSVLGDQETPSEVALNLDYRLQHLLIDEFQDTSLSHYRLLEKLITTWQPNDGRTIFMVGDPMQSIYRFREAEVGLFLRVIRDGIGDLKPQPLTLNTNFRSLQNIVDWNNHNFTKIFPTLANISLGAVPFKPAKAIANNPESAVTITLLKKGDEQTEAASVITTIKKIHDQYPTDTIAILVKARTHLEQIILALRKAKLNYQAFELEVLKDSLVIRDLFSLTRALLDLADRIAWLAILRAPWCGLKLEDLLQVANGSFELIWDNVCHHQTLNLSADGRTRLKKLQTTLLPILDLQGRVAPHELVEKAWLALGGPATVSEERKLEHATIYLELLEKQPDLTILQKKLDTLYTPTTPGANIQIMTIHKAKGLEFDHVIIPGVNRSTRSDEKKLLLWFERPKLHRGSNLLLAPITLSGDNTKKVYQYLQLVEQKKSFYENGRLLYVAMTRAKKSTHIIGNITDTIQSGSLLEQLKPCFDEKWIEEELPKIMNTSDIDNETPTQISRLSSNWQLPITVNIPPSTNSPSFELVDNQAAIIGTVIHQCLRQISEGNLDQANYRKLLQQEGYLSLEQGLKLINEALEKTLKDERGKWILTKHQDAANEVALTTQINGKFIHYIIDRTFIDEHGTRWIIDYKTSKPEANENLETFLNQEAAKYSQQLLEYAAAMHAINPKEIIKLGLYFPLCRGWIEIL